ncbi:MAG: helix-turn-helix domain-containing protein [Methanomicrobiales archaeon]|nr:helix-turn-helix domain-containing protein [Methanomicrobiales archaeon]
MPETLLSPKEAAGRLGVSLTTMRTMIRNGEIRTLRKGKLVQVSLADLQILVDQKRGRMAGDLTMSEERALDEFKRNLIQALEDKGVKQSLRECMGGAGFKDQFLEALDLPEVKEKLAEIRNR